MAWTKKALDKKEGILMLISMPFMLYISVYDKYEN